jgi:hypothetical protein
MHLCEHAQADFGGVWVGHQLRPHCFSGAHESRKGFFVELAQEAVVLGQRCESYPGSFSRSCDVRLLQSSAAGTSEPSDQDRQRLLRSKLTGRSQATDRSNAEGPALARRH